MLVKYDSNNSGGSWWLCDNDWFALGRAGWKVNWFHSDKDSMLTVDKNGYWMGTLATSATKEFNSIEEAKSEFEELTGQDSGADGCSCCGSPHSFYES